MRTTLLIERYRKFAARTRLSMALLALSLFAATAVILVGGARASSAAFLDAEARNIASLTASEDLTLVAVVLFTFAAALVFSFVQPRKSS